MRNEQEYFNNYKHEEVTLDEGIQRQIKATLHRAFWDIFQEELESKPPIYTRLITILEEVRDTLCSFVPNRTDIHNEIHEKIDVTLIKNMVENDAFDDKNLYLAFICADKNTNSIMALAKGEKDIFVSEDDVMAIFLYAEGQGCYYQFALNTRGVKFDQKNIIGGKRLYGQYQPEWEYAVKVHPEYWVTEVKIPLKEIGLKKTPNNMKGNFLRVFRGNLVGHSFWSRTPRAHRLENFGVLNFKI